jgi:hypothetical protein
MGWLVLVPLLQLPLPPRCCRRATAVWHRPTPPLPAPPLPQGLALPSTWLSRAMMSPCWMPHPTQAACQVGSTAWLVKCDLLAPLPHQQSIRRCLPACLPLFASAAGWRTPQGRAVEAGVKGFWYQVRVCVGAWLAAAACMAWVSVPLLPTWPDACHPPLACQANLCQCALVCCLACLPRPVQYHNIFRMVRELGIPWPFTQFETSGFWGPDGQLITQAPVFSQQPRLPAILGQFVHTFNLFRQAEAICGRRLLCAAADGDCRLPEGLAVAGRQLTCPCPATAHPAVPACHCKTVQPSSPGCTRPWTWTVRPAVSSGAASVVLGCGRCLACRSI